MKKNSIKSVFPVVYRRGNKFEILPELILERKDEVWGYEIMPCVVIAKKCGADSNVESANWYNSKEIAQTFVLNGMRGSLPSRSNVAKLKAPDWKGLRCRIQKMDRFLCDNGIDAESRSLENPRYVGVVWCAEENDYRTANYFSLATSRGNYGLKVVSAKTSRLMVVFNASVPAAKMRRVMVR